MDYDEKLYIKKTEDLDTLIKSLKESKVYSIIIR